MIIPTEIIEQIVLYANDVRIADILKKYISKYIYDKIEHSILIHGEVQSGKTKEIITYIQNNVNEYKVLIIQNSLLVLKQYINRFKNEKIKFQVITKDTKIIKENLVLIINNCYRYSYFKKLNVKKYILMIDEADMCIKSCPLQGYKTVHITATPTHFDYSRIITVQQPTNYFGLKDLSIFQSDSIHYPIYDFLSSKSGIMLINRWHYIDEMKSYALMLGIKHITIPIILLSTDKYYYYNGKRINLPNKISVSQIIDMFSTHKHIIFIANRLANRGISFVSSDYKKHLTHQVTKFNKNTTKNIQSLRILGVYNGSPKLKLYVTEMCCNNFTI